MKQIFLKKKEEKERYLLINKVKIIVNNYQYKKILLILNKILFFKVMIMVMKMKIIVLYVKVLFKNFQRKVK